MCLRAIRDQLRYLEGLVGAAFGGAVQRAKRWGNIRQLYVYIDQPSDVSTVQ